MENATGLEQARYPVRADQWNFWKVLACTRGIGLHGRGRNSRLLEGTGNIRSDLWENLFRLIANEWWRLTSSRFPLSVIGLMSTGNLSEKNFGLQSINQSYEIGVELYIVVEPCPLWEEITARWTKEILLMLRRIIKSLLMFTIFISFKHHVT